MTTADAHTADAGRVSECDYGSAILSGTWQGAPFSQTYENDTKITAHESFWLFFTHLDANGFLTLRGNGESPRWQGIPRDASAILLTPTAGPDPQSWYCSSQVTFTHDEVEATTHLTALGRLGTCAGGTPVQGEIVICKEGFLTGCDFTRSGSLDGNTVAEADWMGTGGTSLAYISVAYPDGMIVRFSQDDHFADSGALIDAFVITPPGPPFDGAIYCAGATSSFSGSYNERRVSTLTGFTRVGSCSGITGANELSGCLVGYP